MGVQLNFPIENWNFRSNSILSNFPSDQFERLTQNESVKQYKKGEVIFKEDSLPTGVFLLKEGKVKIYKMDAGDKEHIIYLAAKGDLFGYQALLSEERYNDSASALEPSRIAFIPKNDFLEVLHSSELLSFRLLKNLGHEFRVLATNLCMLAKRNVKERLATQLMILKDKFNGEPETDHPTEISISRDDLANLVGTARENVVRIISGFKADGIVFTKGRKITILNEQKLVEIATGA